MGKNCQNISVILPEFLNFFFFVMVNLYWVDCAGTNCVFFKENETTWWPVSIISKNLKNVGISRRPKDLFKTYEIQPDECRQFSSFFCSFIYFPKTSYFISGSALRRLLKKHHALFLERGMVPHSEDNYYNDSLQFLLERSESPELWAEPVTEKISFSALTKLKQREQQKLTELTTLLLELTCIIQSSANSGTLLDEKTKQHCFELGKQIPKKVKRCFALKGKE